MRIFLETWDVQGQSKQVTFQWVASHAVTTVALFTICNEKSTHSSLNLNAEYIHNLWVESLKPPSPPTTNQCVIKPSKRIPTPSYVPFILCPCLLGVGLGSDLPVFEVGILAQFCTWSKSIRSPVSEGRTWKADECKHMKLRVNSRYEPFSHAYPPLMPLPYLAVPTFHALSGCQESMMF